MKNYSWLELGVIGAFTFLSAIARAESVKVDTTLNILTDESGMTAYTFDLDRPGVSNCNGACATEWPPILVNEATLEAPFSIIIRKDGSRQAAHNGQPLYLYAEDTQPGDLNGDGYSSVWHTARP